MGQPWILVVTAICVTHMALSTNVQYEGITDTAVMQTVTGLRPSTASVGFGFVVTGDTKSNKFRVAVAAGFVMEIVIPSATQFPANRYLSVFITNPTSKTREHCKVLYEELRKGRMTASIVRTTGEDINGKTVDFVVARNAFVAKFGVESIGKAGIMPLDDESKICKFPSYNNAPEFDNGLKMIEIELEPTNFPPNAEVNFPAGVSFMVPKSPTTTAPTTTTIKVLTSTVPEDAPAEAEESIENTTAAVAKASAGKVVAIVVPIVLVIILILVIAILGFVGYLKRETLMAWYTDRKNRGKSTKKDPEGATGASEDQQDGSRSVMPTATDRSTVNPSVQQKSAKQNTSERQKPSEEPSEKSKATVKQTSVEPSAKKVKPSGPQYVMMSPNVKQPAKKADAPDQQYGLVNPQLNVQQPAKKADAPDQQYGLVNPQLNVQQPAKKADAPDQQYGLVNPQLNVQQPAKKADAPDQQYGLVNPQLNVQQPAKKADAPDQQYGLVNPQLNVQQPAKKADAPDQQYGLVNPQLNVQQPVKKAENEQYVVIGDINPKEPPGQSAKSVKAKK